MPQIIVGIVIVIWLIVLTIGQFGGCGKGPGDGEDNSDNSQIQQPEPPIEDTLNLQITPLPPEIDNKINKITIERKEDNNYIRFNDNEPLLVNNKEELSKILENSLPDMNSSVEVIGKGLNDYFDLVKNFLENNGKKIICPPK